MPLCVCFKCLSVSRVWHKGKTRRNPNIYSNEFMQKVPNCKHKGTDFLFMWGWKWGVNCNLIPTQCSSSQKQADKFYLLRLQLTTLTEHLVFSIFYLVCTCICYYLFHPSSIAVWVHHKAIYSLILLLDLCFHLCIDWFIYPTKSKK